MSGLGYQPKSELGRSQAIGAPGLPCETDLTLRSAVGRDGPSADIAADFRATVQTPGRSALGAR
jgi:hypothetical protein